MRVLQHVTGILLTTVGVILVLNAVGTMELGAFTSINWVTFGGLGLFFIACGCALLRRIIDIPGPSCPQCGGTEQQATGFLRKSRVSAAAHLFGWLYAALWNASREQEVRCAGCDHRYQTGTKSTRITGVILWVFVLLTGAGLMAEWLEGK